MPSLESGAGDARPLAGAGPIVYRIYANDGQGGPIDYTSPVGEATGSVWTSDPLPAPGSYRFGVRVLDTATGLEEANIDASRGLILNDEGRDATHTPPAPVGLRALPTAGGRVRLEWASPPCSSDRRPLTFNVYLAAGSVASYAAPTATTPATAGGNGVSFIELSGLSDGVAYAAVVRAANLAGEEANVSAVLFQADSSPPGRVDSLLAASTPRSGG